MKEHGQKLTKMKKINNEILALLKSKEQMVFTTSFGMEDQVLTHILLENNIECDWVTLDTGRNFKETYEVWQKTEKKYGIKIKSVHPNAEQLTTLLMEQGPEGFYHSVEQRKACCNVRKVIPLKQVLEPYKAWITGLRADQTAHRNDMPFTSYDAHFKVEKINPLMDWSWEDINNYVVQHQIPVNTLHRKGYPSIGCAPCTRAILEGEDFRAGRWWWENAHQECGLHLQEESK